NNASLQALYFWTHEAPPISGQYAANNYATYTVMGGAAAAAGGAEPDGIINVGQGFVAKTNQSVLIQFTNDLRLNYSDTQFFRQANTDRHRFWLNLSDEQADYNQILVGYKEGASYGFDHKTDGRFFGHNGSAVYSLIEQDKYTIQGRWPFVETDVVPLGFRAIASGSYNISLEKTDGMFADGQIIFVEDMQLNIIHNLTEDGAYHFVSEAGTFDSRFNIVYQNSTLSAGNPNMTGMDWIAYQDADQIFVKSVGFDIENIEIYDLTGRLLIQEQDINAQSFSVPALFADQVLIVKVNKTMIKKINYNN
ncbi:MAG TPA: hypothetical protein VLZ72_09640, partial [Flavobacterium sp.]|nr:hypothetical protein [Flavobacterium sp.]